MTNEQVCRTWIADVVRGMELDEFCRFFLAFCAGYGDEEKTLKCTDVCGHEPDENCESCAEKVRAWMLEESKNA